jgi:hypothetical protein
VILLAVVALAQAAQANSFSDIPIAPCRTGAAQCYPWDRSWEGDPPRNVYGDFGRANDGAIWSAEIFSIVHGRGLPTPQVWVDVNYSAVRAERARHARILFEFYCSTRQVAVLHSVRYGPADNVLTNWDIGNYFPTYQHLVPGSMQAMLADEVCQPRPVAAPSAPSAAPK